MRSWMIAATLAIASVGLWPTLPSPSLISALLIIALLLVGLLVSLKYRKLVLFIPLILGVGWAYLHGYQLLDSILPQELEGKNILIQGQIASIPKLRPGKASFSFTITHSDDDRLKKKQLKLSWYKAPDIKAGEHYKLLVRLKRPRSFQNPGGFDYESWLIRKGIIATGYVRTSKENVKLNLPSRGFLDYRQALLERLTKHTDNLPQKRFIPALGFGYSGDITSNDWQVLQQTGTIHLLVISGLHIGLAAFWGYLLFSLLSRILYGSLRILPSQKWGLIGGLVVCVFYAALSGFSLPTQRAVVMLCVAFGCRFFSSQISVKDIILISLFGVTILDPLCVYDRGFWLSFGAVIILILGLSNKLSKPQRLYSKLSAWAKAQLVIFIGLLPFLLYLVNGFSLVSPAANLIAVSLVSFLIIPLILISILLTAIHIPPAEFLVLTDYLLDWLWDFLMLCQSLNSLLIDYISLKEINVGSFLALACVSLILIAPKIIPYGRSTSALLILLLIFSSEQKMGAGNARAYILDVGQGLSVYIETKNHNLLFDTGRKYSADFSAASSAIMPFLKQKAETSLSMLVISHHDNDHIGGTGDILTNIKTKALVSSTIPSAYRPLAWQTCRAGYKWTWDQVNFEFLHPSDLLNKKRNNQSCVLKVTTKTGSVLVTGDIEKTAELKLIAANREKLNTDFLVAPHHGSKSSSSLPFIQATKPKWVIFSSGYRNPFNHPHPTVVKRYQDHKINTLNTANSGLISFDIDTESKPGGYRSQKFGYWW